MQDTFFRKVTKLFDMLERILFWFIFLLFCVLIAIVFLQVISRYVISSPALWTVDMALFCLMWLTMMGAALCVRKEAHLTIDLFPNEWDKTIKILSIIANFVIIIISLFLVYQGTIYALDSFNKTAGMTDISLFYFIISIPLGSLLMVLFAIELLIGLFSNQERMNKL